MPNEAYNREVNAITGDSPLWLIDIEHPDIPGSPQGVVRFVQNTENVVSNGYTYTKAGFALKFPSAESSGYPTANIMVDNINELVMPFIDATSGGKGATITFKSVLKNDLDTIQISRKLFVISIQVTRSTMEVKLGYELILDRVCNLDRYDPQSAPSLFEGI